MQMDSREKEILALLFASGSPVSPNRMAAALSDEEPLIRNLTLHLKAVLEDEDFPIRIISLNGSFQLCTAEKYTPCIKRLLNSKRNSPLSQASLEVLAAVAYNEPVTRAYVEQVRGVDCAAILNSLVEKELIEEAGRLDLPGRPIAYKTTENFLRTFGMESLSQLPEIEENNNSKEGGEAI